MNKLQKVIGAVALGATLGLAGCKEYIIDSSNLEQVNMKVVNKEVKISYGKEQGITTFYGKDKYFRINDLGWYNKFELGDIVKISYRSRYMLTFEDTNNDGKKDFVESRFLDDSVLGAQLVSREQR